MNDSWSCLIHVEDTEFQAGGSDVGSQCHSYLKFQFKGRATPGKGKVLTWMTSGLTGSPASSQAPWICDWITSLSFLRNQLTQFAETWAHVSSSAHLILALTWAWTMDGLHFSSLYLLSVKWGENITSTIVMSLSFGLKDEAKVGSKKKMWLYLKNTQRFAGVFSRSEYDVVTQW